jgi:uncharacterized DUF497 family protein
MKIEWDEQKRRQNIIKHGIDFVDVAEIFEGEVVVFEDDRLDYGETRWIALGVVRGRIIVAVYTQTDEALRLISARKATRYEEAGYWRSV